MGYQGGILREKFLREKVTSFINHTYNLTQKQLASCNLLYGAWVNCHGGLSPIIVITLSSMSKVTPSSHLTKISKEGVSFIISLKRERES